MVLTGLLLGFALPTSAKAPVTQAAEQTERAAVDQPSAPTRATSAKIAELNKRAERKRQRSNKLTRFDKPREAVEFFVNKRTGPIITRGPDRTIGARPLDPSQYLKAIEASRKTPFYSSRSGQVLTPDAATTAAVAGGALGTWNALGPNNQGGRTRQLLIDPTNPSIMYTAAVGGGVWKSTDAGASWNQLTDLLLPNIAVAALAMDPSNPQVIYAGTGEGFFNGDAIRGAGMFKTTDAGATWTPLAATTPPPGVTPGDFSYVTQIVVSPRAPQRVYATTRTGLFRSNDGGATWTRLINAAPVYGCQDVTMQVKRTIGYVFAACGTFAKANVYRGLDSAASAFASVFTTANMGRTSLAIAPSNEAYVYAMAAATGTSGGYEDGLLGVYRSTANGNAGTWTTQVSNTNPIKLNTLLLSNPVYGYGLCFGLNSLFNQGWYDNVIAVDPVDPNRVWAGGIDLFRSDDGGQNWGVASYWWFGQGDPQYAHADNHVIRFHPGYNGSSNKTMYVASDGGIFRTDDARANVGKTTAAVCGTPVAGAVAWTELNNNYVTMQFYHGTVYPDGNTFFGGTQDNGTWRGTTASQTWQNLLGGDGGYNAVDTLGDANAANDVLFGEYTGLSIQKSVNGGATFFDAVTGISGDFGFAFIAPFTMNSANRQQLWTGGWYIWRTTNQATNWQRASAFTAGGGSVSAVASSPTDQNKVIVGMSDGYVLFNTAALSAGSGTSWANTRPRTDFVSSVVFDPNDSNTAYATYATFSGLSVYKSSNSGATWAAIPGTGANVLPQVPALSVAVDPGNSSRIYVGTDIGVYTTIDGGVNWYREVTGFGNVSVEQLEINGVGTKYLYAFTHGRGAWRVAINP